MSFFYRPFARVFIMLLMGLLLAWGIVPVHAAIIAANNEATLSAAISNAQVGDTISITNSFTLTGNLPAISTNGLTIEGNDNTLTGGTNIRIFMIISGADVTINNLTMTGGQCNSGCPTVRSGGGGLYNMGTVTLTNSTLSGNSAVSGGGIAMTASGTLTLSNSTISGNSALDGGGIASYGAVLSITRSMLSNNSATNGAGILNSGGLLALTQSTLLHNSATSGGGGIFNTGTVTLTNTTLSGNLATNGGGGIYNNGTVAIINSTLSGNSAISNGSGGGIFNDSSGALTITNSTLSGNLATYGGGVLNFAGTMMLTNSTLFSNLAANSGGSIANDSGTVTLKNTLLGKGVAGGNCDNSGFMASNGAAYNLADDDTCGTNVTQVASLGIGALSANGGVTQTVPLLGGSPAIDAALAADCSATDQRGVARPVGAGCDIGAFEGVVTPTAIPAPALCSLPGFPASAQVAVYLPNGNNGLNVCYTLLTDPVQAGVTDQPFTLAADVYTFDASGSVTTGVTVQVCLQGAGTLLYRSAIGQPRTTVSLPSFSQGGFTCGLIPHAGTVILAPGATAPATAPPAATNALNNCRVTTTHILNLRAAPDATGVVLDLVPYQTTLNVSARSGEWLQVVFGSQQGWLSAAYLTLDGECG